MSFLMPIMQWQAAVWVFCSEELKVIPGRKFIDELRASGVDEVIRLFGFSAVEWQRIQRYTMYGEQGGWAVRFPIAEEGVTKQQCADWCLSLGVRPSAMYSWSDHANCVGCVKGGKAYWLAVKENAPEIFEQRKRQESFFGHQMFKGHVSLSDLERDGMKREAKRESLLILALASVAVRSRRRRMLSKQELEKINALFREPNGHIIGALCQHIAEQEAEISRLNDKSAAQSREYEQRSELLYKTQNLNSELALEIHGLEKKLDKQEALRAALRKTRDALEYAMQEARLEGSKEVIMALARADELLKEPR